MEILYLAVTLVSYVVFSFFMAVIFYVILDKCMKSKKDGK